MTGPPVTTRDAWGRAWVDDALCAQVGDPELWFPAKGASSREARDICGQCPVSEECLTDALSRREPFGVWGGHSERQRRNLLPVVPRQRAS